MVTVLLNNYLPQVWENLSDENILLMVQHVREVIDYIEHGNDVKHDEQDTEE